MAKKNVFISMGSPFAEQQGKFLDALIDLLHSCDVEPRVINKTDYPTGNPLKDISRIMRECQGVIIVAYERTYFESGLEKRRSPQEKMLESVLAIRRRGTRSRHRWHLPSDCLSS